MRRSSPPQRLLASLLASLITVSAFAVPLLDALGEENRVVLESEHNPSTCVRGHDHTICSQVGASQALAAAAPRHGSARVVPAELHPTHEARRVARVVAASHPPRAPPAA